MIPTKSSTLLRRYVALSRTLLLTSAATLSASLFAQPFHVDYQGGDDSNDGSLNAPVKTLERARQLVDAVNDAMTEDIVVYLRGGEHFIDNTVDFDPGDSGMNGFGVIYQAYPGEVPVVTGGVAVTGWTLHDPVKKIWKATTPGHTFRQVYIGNDRAIRSRTPNQTDPARFAPYFPFINVNTTTQVVTINSDAADALAGVTNFAEVEMAHIAHWYHQRLRIANYTPTANGATFVPVNKNGKFSKDSNFYNQNNGAWFFFENSMAFLDADREWYHDESTSELYLCLEDGSDPNGLTITVPVTETLIRITGTAGNTVDGITFEGLVFEGTNWDDPSHNGVNFTQLCQPIRTELVPGAIRGEHTTGLVLRRNTFRKLGGHAVLLHQNTDGTQITRSTFQNIAANGIVIDDYGNVFGDQREESINPTPDFQSVDVVVRNNLIERCGQDYTNGGGMLAHNVRRLRFEHNHVRDMPYSGIQVGNQPSTSSGFVDDGVGENLIRYNYIHHCVQLHDDGGGIYTLGGTQTGSVIAENYLHDIIRSQWAGSYSFNAIYLDNRSNAFLIENNVVKNSTGSIIGQNNGSGNNTLINNTSSNPAVEEAAGIQPNPGTPLITLTPVATSISSYLLPITLAAEASDLDGSILEVRFYDGETLLGTDDTAPYEYIWTDVSIGTHTISAIAVDNDNNTQQSEELEIEVFDPLTTPTVLSFDGIIGARNVEAEPLGYYTDGGVNPFVDAGVVGTLGGTNQQADRNLIIGMSLPVLSGPPEQVVFNFEISGMRDIGLDGLPDLHVYLLDTIAPEATSTDFFYHGNSDPSANVAFVGSTSVNVGSSTGQTFTDDSEDRSMSLSGDALALFQSFYDLYGNPLRSEVFFRLNLSSQPPMPSAIRYHIDTDPAETTLNLIQPLDPDADNDGIADIWETTYFPEQGGDIDGSLDSDGDGVSDFFEYLSGSNPTDPAERGFQMEGRFDSVANNLVAEWTVKQGFMPGTDYRILFSTDLSDWDDLPAADYSISDTTESGNRNVTLELTRDFGDKVFLRLAAPGVSD